jgi:hypothetical protein
LVFLVPGHILLQLCVWTTPGDILGYTEVPMENRCFISNMPEVLVTRSMTEVF